MYDKLGRNGEHIEGLVALSETAMKGGQWTYHEIKCLIGSVKSVERNASRERTKAILYLFPVRLSCVTSPSSFAFPVRCQ